MPRKQVVVDSTSENSDDDWDGNSREDSTEESSNYSYYTESEQSSEPQPQPKKPKNTPMAPISEKDSESDGKRAGKRAGKAAGKAAGPAGKPDARPAAKAAKGEKRPLTNYFAYMNYFRTLIDGSFGEKAKEIKELWAKESPEVKELWRAVNRDEGTVRQAAIDKSAATKTLGKGRKPPRKSEASEAEPASSEPEPKGRKEKAGRKPAAAPSESADSCEDEERLLAVAKKLHNKCKPKPKATLGGVEKGKDGKVIGFHR